MDPRFVEEFGAAVDEVASNGSVRTLLITARGPSFCVGGDLGYFSAHADRHAELLGWMVDHWHAVLARLSVLDMPVVTAVQGETAGGGLGLVWCADHVVEAIRACAVSTDSAEGIRAFLAKEKPTFMDPYPTLVAVDRN
jgi:enoyl-CoA hydratase/carnithine racemase